MIKYLKDKYYWIKNYRKLDDFFKIVNETKILLFGYPKSGNTWLRFLLYNYRELLINPSIEKTITYDRLNSIQNNLLTFHFFY